MRIIKFIAVFLGTLLFIGAIIIIPAWNSIKTIFSNSTPLNEGIAWVNKTSTERGFVNYLKASPENGSYYSIDLSRPDSSIIYRDTIPHPMGSVSNFLLIIEYARQIDNGMLSANEQISLSAINRFVLPGDNTNAHRDALRFLSHSHHILAGNHILLKDIPLMITAYNDEAAADYLYMKLGTGNLDNLPQNFNCKDIEPPLPWSGLTLAESLPTSVPDSIRIARLLAMPRGKFRQMVIEKTDSLQKYPAYRTKMVKKMSLVENNISFQILNTENRLLPKATAKALGTLLSRVMRDSLINARVSQIILDDLQWKTHNPTFDARFTYYGGLFGQRVGMLAGLDASISHDTGDKNIQVTLLEKIPLALWLHLSSVFMNQNFMQRMAVDPSFHAFTYNRLNKEKP